MAAVAVENYSNLLEMEVGTGGVEARLLSSTHLSIRKTSWGRSAKATTRTSHVLCFQAHCLRGGHQRVMIYTCLHHATLNGTRGSDRDPLVNE